MKLRMRTKILAVCLLSTLTALVIQTFLFQRASASLIYQQAENESFHTLENMQNELYTFFKNIENGLIEIYNDKEFVQDMSGRMTAGELREKHYRRAYAIATESFTTSDNVVAVYIYNKDHEIVSTYRRAVTPKHNYPKDIYEDAERYNGEKVKEYIASSDTDMLISSYYNPYREKNIVRFVLKIYNNTNLADTIGYVICDVDSGALQKIMEKYVINEKTYIWLQPMGDRQIFAIGNLEEDSRPYYETIDRCIREGKSDELKDISGGSRVLFQVSQKKYNLDAYSVMPQEMLRQNQQMLTRNLILIAVLLIFLMTAVSTHITKSVTKPLEMLTETMTKIRSGNTDLRVEYLAQDEIGQLGKECNEMLDEIQRLIGKEYENQLLLNKAEYKALQAQINPHFLYNTLDTMSSISSIQNCEIVSSLCQSLSSIFRYSLDMKHPYSTVAQEVNHLKNYIFVMNVRMREEVRYGFHIAEEVLSDSVPRISLQPLVENALNHGLKNKRGEKRIGVYAEAEDGLLCIMVTDNGIGMDGEEVNRRLRENDKSAIESGNSIGIYNINARMKMLYGEEYGVCVESAPGEGCRVILRIPRLKVDEVEAWKK
ncbi:MAG: sensor histidine kinase [Lachnospiraceae bacterium]|nr:sensor histidine kinase [Lachnospiraceae bacterium]